MSDLADLIEKCQVNSFADDSQYIGCLHCLLSALWSADLKTASLKSTNRLKLNTDKINPCPVLTDIMERGRGFSIRRLG